MSLLSAWSISLDSTFKASLVCNTGARELYVFLASEMTRKGGSFSGLESKRRCLEGKMSLPKAGVLVRKLSQVTPLSLAKRAIPRYFIMLCGTSCELASCVHWPIVDSESTIASWGQTKL